MSLQDVFVGREEEQEELKDIFNQSKKGEGKAVFVTGPAGIGKTYLVEMLFERMQGVRFLHAKCSEDDQPYELVVKLLRRYLDVDTHQMYGKEAEEYPSIAKQCKEIERTLLSPESGNRKGQQTLFSTVQGILSSIGKNTPLVVFADNLHVADSSSLSFISYHLENMEDSPFLFVGTYRDEDLNEEHMLRTISVDGSIIQQICLEPLSAIDVLDMVERILGVEDMPTLFIKRLYKETGGNPLFVREVVRVIMEDATIDRSDPYWYTKIDLGSVSLPTSLKEIVLSHLKRLDKESRMVLEYGAAVGQSFSSAVLEKTLEKEKNIPISNTKRMLSSLADLKLIREEGDSKADSRTVFKFEYPELRDLIYDGIKNRKDVHGFIAPVLEEMNQDVYSIARQYSLAGDDEKAWVYGEKAGDQAILAMAPTEALKHFTKALKAMENVLSKKKTSPETEEASAKLLLKVGDVNHSLGEMDKAMEMYKRALKIAEKLKANKLIAGANLKMGDVYRTRSRWGDAQKDYSNALDLAEKMEDKYMLAQSLRGLGYLDWRKGDFKSAIARYSRALKYAEETKDINLVAVILIEFGNVYNEKGELDKALRYYLKSVDILTKSKDLSELARAYNNIGDTYLQMGQWKNAVAFFKKTGAVAEKIGNKSMMGWALFNAAEALSKGGDPDKAINFADGGLRILEKIGDEIGLSGVYKGYGIAYRMKKEWDKAEENFKKSIELGQSANSPYTLGEIYLETSSFYIDKGDNKQAEKYLKKAERIGKDIGAKVLLERVEKERKRNNG